VLVGYAVGARPEDVRNPSKGLYEIVVMTMRNGTATRDMQARMADPTKVPNFTLEQLQAFGRDVNAIVTSNPIDLSSPTGTRPGRCGVPVALTLFSALSVVLIGVETAVDCAFGDALTFVAGVRPLCEASKLDLRSQRQMTYDVAALAWDECSK
jgi:hypothetical protein